MKNFDQIERYLNGEMQEAEKLAFEAAIAKDPALAEAVKLQAFEDDAIDLMVEESLAEEVRKIRSEVPAEAVQKKSISGSRWLQIAVAASIVLVAGFFANHYLNQPPSLSSLAATYYAQHPPNFSPPRQVGNEQDQKELTYLKLLNNRDASRIDAAIGYYSQAEAGEASYKLGHAYFIKKDFGNAIRSFQKFREVTLKTQSDYQRAQFYEALAHLAMEETESAVSILQGMESDQNHIYRPQAEALLKALD